MLTDQDKTALCVAVINAVEATAGDNSVATCTVVAGVLVSLGSYDGAVHPATTIVLLTFTEHMNANGQCDIVAAEKAIRENPVELTISTGTVASSEVYNPLWDPHGSDGAGEKGRGKNMGRGKNRKPKCKKKKGNKHGLGPKRGKGIGNQVIHHAVKSNGQKVMGRKNEGKFRAKIARKQGWQVQFDKGSKSGPRERSKFARKGIDAKGNAGNDVRGDTVALAICVTITLVLMAAGALYVKRRKTQPVTERKGEYICSPSSKLKSNVVPASSLASVSSQSDIGRSATIRQITLFPMSWDSHMQNVLQRGNAASADFQGEYIFTGDVEYVETKGTFGGVGRSGVAKPAQ